MTQHDLEYALGRARLYAGFHHMLEVDPVTALREYDLTPAERRAILDRDPEALRRLGAGLDLAAWWGIVDQPLQGVR